MTSIRHTVTCPVEFCRQPPGSPCKDKRGIPLTYQHKRREQAARDAADGVYDALMRAAGEEGARRE